VTEQRDIVERLEHAAFSLAEGGPVAKFDSRLMQTAAAEITRLREQLAEAQGQEAHGDGLLERVTSLMQSAVAERDTLREQLRISREGLEYLKNGTVPAMVQHLDDTLARMEARNDQPR